ncbi:hypothetical protein [Dyadobacter tibetensis]|uniref:hypothetical protein n=1 Tax=Dyadobacter tibetensis TaxID=1211851 RepID=UPI0004AE3A1A|nr:hypothetical protein [Dyadobacter tibetensis]
MSIELLIQVCHSLKILFNESADPQILFIDRFRYKGILKRLLTRVNIFILWNAGYSLFNQ